MEPSGWVVAFILLFAFIYFSFKTWIVWWSQRHRDDYDDLEPLTDEFWNVKR